MAEYNTDRRTVLVCVDNSIQAEVAFDCELFSFSWDTEFPLILHVRAVKTQIGLQAY